MASPSAQPYPGTQSGPPAKTGGTEAVERFCKRFDRAKANRDQVAPIIDDCYELALPLRERANQTTSPGSRRTDRLFDGTAPTMLQGLASRILDDIWPTDARPFDLLAGREVPPEDHDELNRRLAEVADDIISTINNSDFSAAAHEALSDWTISTGVMMIDAGDVIEPVRFTCLPFSQAVLDSGPFGKPDALFREREVKACDILTIWPDATLDDEMKRDVDDQPDKPWKFVEGIWRDWSVKGTETWRYSCVAIAKKASIKDGTYEGAGSCPFVAFSFMRVAGEVYGRGPVQIALPDVKSLNIAVEMTLENADLALSGLWTIDDDGVVNVDTITLAPGTVIPKAQGSEGLKPITSPARFDVADMLTGRLEAKIKEALFDDDLGPLDQTPRSATEVMARSNKRAKRLAGPAARLFTEFLFPVVRRVAHIRRQQGAIKVPALDGRLVAIRPLSPLTRLQAQDEILRADRTLELLSIRGGPQLVGVAIKMEEYAVWLAAKMGFNPNLVRTKVEREQMAKAIAAAMQMAAAQGMAPKAA